MIESQEKLETVLNDIFKEEHTKEPEMIQP